MARNKWLKLVQNNTAKSGGRRWQVVGRSDGHVYATLYRTPQGQYSFTLVNYPHRGSRLFGSESGALEAIEREVF